MSVSDFQKWFWPGSQTPMAPLPRARALLAGTDEFAIPAHCLAKCTLGWAGSGRGLRSQTDPNLKKIGSPESAVSKGQLLCKLAQKVEL